MHWEAFKLVSLVRDHFPSYFHKKRVVEVGSYCVNYSVRTLFDQCDYLGIDLIEDSSVDLVASDFL